MAYKGSRVFSLRPSDIEEYLMADTSDCEDALVLDEEDQAFIEQDMAEGASEVIIEPANALDTAPTPTLSSSTIPCDTLPPPSMLPNFQWRKNSYKPYNFPGTDYDFGKINILQQSTPLNPIDIFEAVTGMKSLIEDIIMPESILYAQQNGTSFTTDYAEITAFLGINYVMGYHVLPSLRSYWSTEPDMGVPYIANIMPLSRFEDVRKYLHFCNNQIQPPLSSPDFDRAFKIRRIIDHFNVKFQVAMNNTVTQSVDEHMVKLKGHNIMKQFMQNKPVKMGFKMWCRADSQTGYLFQFDIYTGKNADKDMKRGDIYSTSFEGISFVKWMDNKGVHLLTNFLSPIPTQIVKRRQIGSSQKLNVTCPDIVCKYNKNMGGVDLMDQRKVTYEVDRKSRIKYYLRLFFDFLDIAMNNAYIIYVKLHEDHKIEGSQLSSLEYRQLIARAMIAGFSSRKNALPSMSMTKKRIINSNRCQKTSLPTHNITKVANRKRCVQCAKSQKENRTNNICEMCNVHLCFTADRNCFAAFHA